MTYLRYRVADHIGHLTLNRPDKYNAFDRQMVDDFEQFWQERRYDDSVRVIIMDGGQSRGFCAGLDMDTFAPDMFNAGPADIYHAQSRMARVLLSMRQAPQPIVCCIHGAAAGIGFSLAMASDIRVMAEGSRCNAAYINIGLGGADMASSYFLPRLIGAGRANEFLLTGNWMNAEEALALGFASRVVPRDRLLDTAMELATVMAGKNPLALHLTKEAINVNLDAGGLEAALNMEDRNQVMAIYAMKLATPTGS